jgi:hypothetical protein
MSILQKTNTRNNEGRGSQHELIYVNRQDTDFEVCDDASAMPTNQTTDPPSNPLVPEYRGPALVTDTRGGDEKFFGRLKDLARRILKSFQGFLALIFAISIFGAQTFNSLVGQLGQPSTFSENTVRVFMAISWLLFIISLAVSVFAAVMIDPYVTEIGLAETEMAETEMATGRATFKNSNAYKYFAVGVVVAAELLLLISFVFMGLVVMAYAKVVGILAICACGLTGLTMVGAWVVKLSKSSQSQNRSASDMA